MGAADATTRSACEQKFLFTHLRRDPPNTVVERAALRLWRNPVWPVRRLAYSLDISERQLTRRFRALVGTTPKQFARIARIGKAVAAKRHGASWADIAWLNSLQRIFLYKKRCFYRAIVSPKSHSMPRSVI